MDFSDLEQAMARLTISVEDELAAEFDLWVERKGYLNRSEAFRDLVCQQLAQTTIEERKGMQCVATVSFIYDHHERQLSNRLVQMQHEHHHVAIASQHVHLDHDNCLETVILKGRMEDVRACGDAMVSQTGVRNGNVHLVPLAAPAGGYLQLPRARAPHKRPA